MHTETVTGEWPTREEPRIKQKMAMAELERLRDAAAETGAECACE